MRSLSSLLLPFARRFVAGQTAAEAVEAVRQMNARGIGGIIDFLGEDVHSSQESEAAVEEYLHLLEVIHTNGVDSAISLKASQLGLLLDTSRCFENLQKIVQKAHELHHVVWIDMEGSSLTEKTVDVFERVRSTWPNVGLCLQAYLSRTEADLNRLMRRPVWIRLCKGAYKEPAGIAYQEKREVDLHYRILVERLLDQVSRHIYPGFATHDRVLMDSILNLVQKKGIHRDQFEFQMLYGIQNNFLETLTKKGYRTRVYIPYGTAWLPYFLRRLRERKENIYFLARSIFRM